MFGYDRNLENNISIERWMSINVHRINGCKMWIRRQCHYGAWMSQAGCEDICGRLGGGHGDSLFVLRGEGLKSLSDLILTPVFKFILSFLFRRL